jgi:hypothetical protein
MIFQAEKIFLYIISYPFFEIKLDLDREKYFVKEDMPPEATLPPSRHG